MSDPFKNYDNWLTHDPAQDEPETPEEGFCPHCNEEMEFEPDVDCDEETGRAYYCGGGSWICKTTNCPPDKQEAIEE